MSTRKTVLDAVVSAMQANTAIKHATRDTEAWWEWPTSRFPGVMVLDNPAETERIAFPSTSGHDMEARLPLEVRGYVYHKGNILDSARADLLEAIEETLVSSTTISGVVKDVEVDNIESDRGQIENFSICAVNATVVYHYNHLDP